MCKSFTGLKILVEMIFSSLWAQVLGLSASPSDEVQQSAAEQLFILTENLFMCKLSHYAYCNATMDVFLLIAAMKTSEPPRLLNAFLDFIMIHLFCNSSKLNGVRLLDRYNQLSITRTNTSNLPEDFPWGVWQPATSVVLTLTHVSEVIFFC